MATQQTTNTTRKPRTLTIKDGAYTIDKPSQMANMAQVLKAHIVTHKLYTPIAGKNYVHVEGWQFAGGLLGLFPKIVKVENLSSGQEIKWMAEAHIVKRDKEGEQTVGVGIAICSNKENKKKSFDEYAILSMAQTRSIGKAYRNLIGWVMKLAGYEGTPSEEIVKMGEKMPEPNGNGNGTVKTPPKQEEWCKGTTGKGCPVGNLISEAEKRYTTRVYKKALCRECQKELKAKTSKK